MTFKIEDGITLECDHRYCIDCIKNYFIERIMSSNVSEEELICPDCGKSVDHNIIKGVVPEKTFENYLNFAFRN